MGKTDVASRRSLPIRADKSKTRARPAEPRELSAQPKAGVHENAFPINLRQLTLTLLWSASPIEGAALANYIITCDAGGIMSWNNKRFLGLAGMGGLLVLGGAAHAQQAPAATGNELTE